MLFAIKIPSSRATCKNISYFNRWFCENVISSFSFGTEVSLFMKCTNVFQLISSSFFFIHFGWMSTNNNLVKKKLVRSFSNVMFCSTNPWFKLNSASTATCLLQTARSLSLANSEPFNNTFFLWNLLVNSCTLSVTDGIGNQ